MKNIFLKEKTDDLAYEQFDKCCEHPAFRKGALMPDAHGGYDAPIGGVFALKDWVVPSWVGYDIGCGMCAINLGIKKENLSDYKLQELHTLIHKYVPCGDKMHGDEKLFDMKINRKSEAIRESFANRKVALQYGTLGNGNHFLELSTDTKGDVWVVIHSGSRGFGHGVGTYWLKKQKENANIGFYLHSKEGKQYVEDLETCLEYALGNRLTMLKQTIKAIEEVYSLTLNPIEETFINRNHNHMDISHDLCIHRKGATHAEDGMFGVIPANMRDGSFIIKGKGNEESLWSSSHGAGRKMSRTEANNTLSLDEFKEQMNGIVGDVSQSTLDEAPNAYKNIYDVMQVQVDNNMLEIVEHIKPFLNIKG